MVIRPKHVAVTELNIQNSVALDGNPEPDYAWNLTFFFKKRIIQHLQLWKLATASSNIRNVILGQQFEI
jgi:hypothetical protein